MKLINRIESSISGTRIKLGKWLAEALGKNEATVSRWCTNEMQPSLETLVSIANALNVDVRELLVSTKKAN